MAVALATAILQWWFGRGTNISAGSYWSDSIIFPIKFDTQFIGVSSVIGVGQTINSCYPSITGVTVSGCNIWLVNGSNVTQSLNGGFLFIGK